MKALGRLWYRFVLRERPSVSLGFFRMAAAFTVLGHVLPTLFHMKDNYLHGAFKEKNVSIFTLDMIVWAEKSPDALVWAMAVVFVISAYLYALGLFGRTAGWLMLISCYFFYAVNSLHIGTLSWDILLVTVFILCLTPYPSDFNSFDAVLKHEKRSFDIRRPFFIQRMLQIQIALTYFYTGLVKITHGNWFSQNPIYYLLNSIPQSAVKDFPFRSLIAQSPDLCYAIGLTVVFAELAAPFVLFWRRTRPWAIAAGILFHILLVITLHVPTIFFFLFIPGLLLFISPNQIADAMDRIRLARAERGRHRLLYDGHCVFCRSSVAKLEALDTGGTTEFIDFQTQKDLTVFHPALTYDKCHSQIQLISRKGKLYSGFKAFRFLSLRMPQLMALAPLLYIPGMGFLGQRVYQWIAENRYLFHSKQTCTDNHCFRN